MKNNRDSPYLHCTLECCYYLCNWYLLPSNERTRLLHIIVCTFIILCSPPLLIFYSKKRIENGKRIIRVTMFASPSRRSKRIKSLSLFKAHSYLPTYLLTYLPTYPPTYLPVRPVKSRQMSKKVAQNDFTRKIKDFDTFAKIA